MPATKHGFELQDDTDIPIIKSVYQCRLLTIDHLAALSGRSMKALRSRLLKLERQKYLACPKRYRQKKCYALGPESKPLLIRLGYASQSFANRRLRDHELKEIFIEHTLLASDTIVKLLLQERTSRIKILNITHDGPDLWDKAPAGAGSDGKEKFLSIRPDFKITLKDTARPEGKNTASFFVEDDRGSEADEVIEEKVRGFLSYNASQRYLAKHPGMKVFQVLFVTLKRSRAEHLATAMTPILPEGLARRAYHFMPIGDLTLESLFPPLPSV